MSSRPMEEDGVKNEEEEFNTPLSIRMMSVKNHTQVLINCRNNRKLFGTVRALLQHSSGKCQGDVDGGSKDRKRQEKSPTG